MAAFLPLAATALTALLSSRQRRQPEQVQTFSTQSRQQQNLMDEILRAARGEQGVSPGIAQLFAPVDQAGIRQQFEEGFGAPRRQEFIDRIAPGIRSQFLTAGAGRSSAANEAIQRSGQELEGGLDQALSQALFGAEEGRRGSLASLLSGLLGQQTQQTVLRPGSPGGFEQFLGGLLPAVASGIGGGLGKSFGSMFSNNPFGAIGQQQRASFSGLPSRPSTALPEFSTRIGR